MAWSIFQSGDPVAWAHELLADDGAPQTPGNVQFVYDWERSEGGGGKYDPLNQGPVPGHPELTTTGSQYGGGAADFASPAAGLQGAVDYLHMPNFAGINAHLLANDPTGARAALIASPWASGHYADQNGNPGGGFNNSPVPGGTGASVLPGTTPTWDNTTGPSSSTTGGTVQTAADTTNTATQPFGSGVDHLPFGITIWSFPRIAFAIMGMLLILFGLYITFATGGSTTTSTAPAPAGNDDEDQDAEATPARRQARHRTRTTTHTPRPPKSGGVAAVAGEAALAGA